MCWYVHEIIILNYLSFAGGIFRKKMNEIVRQIIISVLEAGIEYIPPSKCLLPVLGKKHYFFPGMDSVVEGVLIQPWLWFAVLSFTGVHC